jgi:hypothetical protein
VKIEKKSIFTGRTAVMEINVTPEQIEQWQRSGRNIQDALPWLTPSEREFLLSGTTDAEWDELFKDEGDQ